MTEAESRKARALLALAGLSVGDAFGEQFFVESSVLDYRVLNRVEPAGFGPTIRIWRCRLQKFHSSPGPLTKMHLSPVLPFDMTCCVVMAPPCIGFCVGLPVECPGRKLPAPNSNGKVSYGNGSAMRVGPVEAWYADDLDQVIEMAKTSAIVTHAHSEAVAGAVAVAIAGALAWTLFLLRFGSQQRVSTTSPMHCGEQSKKQSTSTPCAP
jgi:ADP-ribosylglycohydrolase